MGLFNWKKKKVEKVEKKVPAKTNHYSGRSNLSNNSSSNSNDDTLTTLLLFNAMSDNSSHPSSDYVGSSDSSSYDCGSSYDGASDGDGGGASWD